MPEQLPLRDIKSIVAVPDHSLWLFAALVAAALIVAALLLFWLLRRTRKGGDPRRAEALRRLEAIDYGDTKRAVYDFSLLGHFVLTPQNEAPFRALVERLEAYKFQKTVPPLEEGLAMEMKQFVKEARRG